MFSQFLSTKICSIMAVYPRIRSNSCCKRQFEVWNHNFPLQNFPSISSTKSQIFVYLLLHCTSNRFLFPRETKFFSFLGYQCLAYINSLQFQRKQLTVGRAMSSSVIFGSTMAELSAQLLLNHLRLTTSCALSYWGMALLGFLVI